VRFSNDAEVLDASPPAKAGRSRQEPTSQQAAFYDELIEGSGHVLLSARAGTGKSTSCREGMWRLLEAHGDVSVRYCCFNKKIADEFAEKSPPTVDVGTMHRFGLQALQSAFGCQIDKQKSYTILDGLGGADLKGYYRRAIVKLVGLAKNHGLKPGDRALPAWIDEFIDRFDVETYRQRDMVIARTIQVFDRSAEMTTIVDFDDMLWLPTLHPVRFPSVDFLFIDECQDLNPVQHELAERLSGSGRTVVVGDPYQAIYGFRGADSESIPKLRDKLDARTMDLTVTFRCPRKHVELARQLVADFECGEGAPDGTLEYAAKDAIDLARPGDLVLCRANAPIIQACLRQIANLVPSVVRGRAIGDSLVSIVKKLPDAATIANFTRELNRWRSAELMRLEAKDGAEDLIEQLADKTAGLEAIASACSSPAEIPAAIQRLFSDEDPTNRVNFSSVHRAKGSEARNVLYIQIPYGERRDRERPPAQWELDQRRNLRYVALTRSLDSLTLIS
jgi:DNA helicase-2/ATP-dependent DNA helicase PcrA